MSTKTFTKDISVINYKQIAYTPPGTPTNNWSGLTFPPGTISNTGCSLVSAAMILNYLGEVDDLTKTQVTPYDVWRKGNFGVVDFNFYNLRDMFNIPLNYSPTDFSDGFESIKSVMFDYIYNKGIPLIVRGYGYSTDGKEQGHFVVVRGFQGTLGIDAVTGYPITGGITATMFKINDPGNSSSTPTTLQDMLTHYRVDKNAPGFDLVRIAYYIKR